MAGYNCDSKKFVYLNDKGKVVASEYTVDCDNIKKHTSPLITQTNMNLALPMLLKHSFPDHPKNEEEYNEESDKVISDSLFDKLLNLLDKPERIQKDAYTRKRRKSANKKSKRKY